MPSGGCAPEGGPGSQERTSDKQTSDMQPTRMRGIDRRVTGADGPSKCRNARLDLVLATVVASRHPKGIGAVWLILRAMWYHYARLKRPAALSRVESKCLQATSVWRQVSGGDVPMGQAMSLWFTAT
jgi:hypothetical protein